MIVKHYRTGFLYRVVSMNAEMKHPTTGNWINAVVYVDDKEGDTYFRTVPSFRNSFEQIEEHV